MHIAACIPVHGITAVVWSVVRLELRVACGEIAAPNEGSRWYERDNWLLVLMIAGYEGRALYCSPGPRRAGLGCC